MTDAATPIEIFKPGRQVASDGRALAFSEADPQATAAAYDPALHEAPIVVGRPADDAPAYGWIGGLSYSGGALAATPRQVDAAFAELVGAGRFKKVSACFYVPGAASNPAPGGYYPRHVGFLGAQPPAVRGLKPAAFAAAEAGDAVTFSMPAETVAYGDMAAGAVARLFQKLREFLISKEGQGAADRVLPDWRIEALKSAALAEEPPRPAAFSEPSPGGANPGEDRPMTDTDPGLAEREAALAAREAEAARKDAEFAEVARRQQETATALALRAAETAVDRLVAAGRVAPGHRDGLAAFMAQLDDAETVAFGEGEGGGKATQRAWFEGFLAALPQQISFGEMAAGDRGGDASNPQALANAAIAYRESQAQAGVEVPIEKAVRRVAGGDGGGER